MIIANPATMIQPMAPALGSRSDISPPPWFICFERSFRRVDGPSDPEIPLRSEHLTSVVHPEAAANRVFCLVARPPRSDARAPTASTAQRLAVRLVRPVILLAGKLDDDVVDRAQLVRFASFHVSLHDARSVDSSWTWCRCPHIVPMGGNGRSNRRGPIRRRYVRPSRSL